MLKRPNIILIQTDQLSAGSLGLYGNPVVKTPTLERLAQGGVLFDYAFCNYPACAPSRSSMMTGRYTSTIRNHANHMLINPQEVTMPLAFKQAGYEIALIGKNHAFLVGENYYPDCPAGEASNKEYDEVSRNFDYVFGAGHVNVKGKEEDEELAAYCQWALKNCWGNQHKFGVNPYPAEKSITYTLATKAVDYITRGRDREKPFFLWLSFPDPHTPYQVSEPYANLYNPDDIPEPIEDELCNKPERQRVAMILDYNDKYDKYHFKQIRAIHYGMINQIDDNLARVFKCLREQGLEEDTIIVFTSDHGDAMGDHGIIQKHNFFYESFTRIPLIVSWPGKIKPARSGHLIELVDIMPTLLELAQLKVPFGVQGKSFAPYLLDLDYQPKEYIVIESGEHGEPVKVSDILDEEGSVIDKGTSFAWCAFREAWYGKGKCIRTHEWKLCIYGNGEGELYNLKNDPNELINLFDTKGCYEIKNRLIMKLLLWCIENEDRIPINTTVAPKYHYLGRRDDNGN